MIARLTADEVISPAYLQHSEIISSEDLAGLRILEIA